MARVVKQPEERRQEILDTAQALYAQQGYDATSVQAIVDAIGIAKGTFYHYFDSKEDVLEALLERLFDEIVAGMEVLVADEKLDALQKFNGVFHGTAAIKIGYQPVLKPLLGAFLRSESALIREKTQNETIRRIAPPLALIIGQGEREGVFDTSDPLVAAEITMHIGQKLGYALLPLFVNSTLTAEEQGRITAVLGAYEEAVARILGAAPGAINMVAPDIIDRWFAAQAEKEMH